MVNLEKAKKKGERTRCDVFLPDVQILHTKKLLMSLHCAMRKGVLKS
jgi:hypothetical protein